MSAPGIVGLPEGSAMAVLATLAGTTPQEIEARHSGTLASNPNNRVKDSPEFRRIRDLPRRDWAAKSEALAHQITEAFRTPWGAMKLRPIQAASLFELYTFGGLFAPINVGGGKTLVSYLAPAIIQAQRPLLLVPAKLRAKTEREFESLKAHFRGAPYIRILSYEMLGRVQSADILKTYRPDLIISDEVHKLKNARAAVTRRVSRWMKEAPETRFVALSGTITNRSLNDYAHIAAWCLPRTLFLPSEVVGPGELETWAAALDENKNALVRPSPGALFDLCSPEERAEIPIDPLGAARKAFRRRMVETPGVIATQGGALGTSLEIFSLEVPNESPLIDEAFNRMRTTWETPDGHPIADGLALWRHARELACGFFYRWNPRPPEDWLEARREWASLCRDVLSYNRRGLDSQLQVVMATDAGHYPPLVPALAKWRAIKPTFEPSTECVWLSDAVLKTAADWLHRNPGICWVEHTFFGLELAKRTGIPYYSRGGQDGKGRRIEDHPHTKPLIASVASNAEGRNLQGWSSNLVISAPPTNKVWEQLMGRTHRPGQLEDTVTVEIIFNCFEQVAGFGQARKDALFTQQTTGQDQKLVYADIDVLDQDLAGSRGGLRWRK